MPNKVFTTEHMVILTSKIPIDCAQWNEFIIENWKNLIRKNTKFLVLAGVHGKSDGKLGSKDTELLLDYEYAIKGLKKQFKDDIVEKNAQIILENVGNHIDSTKLDDEKLVEAIKKHNPTVISLAFCFTNVSELNDILRSAGIYSALILSEDKYNMTEGKYVVLDTIQKQVIKKVVEDRPKNIFLWGSSGSGKTILLAQALSIKISYYKRLGLPINVFVSSYTFSKDQLMEDLKHKYLTHLKDDSNVTFLCISALFRSKYHN